MDTPEKKTGKVGYTIKRDRTKTSKIKQNTEN